MTARVVGLDLSLVATGVAGANDALTTWRPTVPGDERLVEIAARTAQLVAADMPTLAVIEDFVVRTPAAGIAGMVHGVVRCELLRRGVRYVLVPPATLKTYATGRGNATKPDMRVELLKRAGLDERDDNRVDAWWLRAMGLDAMGSPPLDLPQTHRRALVKVDWPKLAVVS